MRNDGTPLLLDFGAARHTLSGEGIEAAADLHAGLRLARAARRGATCSGPGATSIRWARPCTPRSPAASRRKPPTCAWRRTSSCPARSAWGGKYSAELLDIVDWCLRLDHLERPQSVLRAAERPCSASGSPSGAPKRRSLDQAARRDAQVQGELLLNCTLAQETRIGARLINQDRFGHWRTGRCAADGGGRRAGRAPARRARGAARGRLFRHGIPARSAAGACRPGAVPRPRRWPARTPRSCARRTSLGLPDAPRTVIVACLVQDGNAYWTHIGDCRLYLVRQGRIAVSARATTPWCSSSSTRAASGEEAASIHPERNRSCNAWAATCPAADGPDRKGAPCPRRRAGAVLRRLVGRRLRNASSCTRSLTRAPRGRDGRARRRSPSGAPGRNAIMSPCWRCAGAKTRSTPRTSRAPFPPTICRPKCRTLPPPNPTFCACPTRTSKRPSPSIKAALRKLPQ